MEFWKVLQTTFLNKKRLDILNRTKIGSKNKFDLKIKTFNWKF